MDAEEAARLRGEQFRLRCRTRRERRLKAADVRKQCFIFDVRFVPDTSILRSRQAPISVCCGRREGRYRYRYVAVGARADTDTYVAVGARADTGTYIAVVASAGTGILRSSEGPILVHILRSSQVPVPVHILRSSEAPIPVYCGRRENGHRYSAIVASACIGTYTYILLSSQVPIPVHILPSSHGPIPVECDRRKLGYR